MAQFIPAIITNDKAEFETRLVELTQSVSRIHIDFADGHFVSNQTLGAEEIDQLPEGVEFDAHLMVEDPEQYLPVLQAKKIKRTIIHFETDGNLGNLLEKVRAHSLEAILAINPETPVRSVAPLIGQVTCLQIMGVRPGFANQPFLPQTTQRVKEAKRLYSSLPIAVDGGVRLDNALDLLGSGADYLIASHHGYELLGSSRDGIVKWKRIISQFKEQLG